MYRGWATYRMKFQADDNAELQPFDFSKEIVLDLHNIMATPINKNSW